jgi:Xaa-Pro aminopeptidase
MRGMAHDYARRLERAAEEVGTSGLDALVVAPSADLVYLIGYDPPALPRLTAMVIRPSTDPILLVPELERPRAEASAAGRLVELSTWADGEDSHAVAGRLLDGDRRLAVSDRMWASHVLGLQRALPGASFEPASSLLATLRSIKDADEMALLARAGRGADETFRRICREGLEGRSEQDVASSLAGHLLDAGHESVAFTIVASGPNGASPHHEPAGRRAQRGDAVVLDFGGRIGGYCSDMTRTVSVGEPPQKVKEVYEIVREAQEAAFQAVRPGVQAEEVDGAARNVIEDAGYGEGFIHRTGHGIGLDEHEPPWIVRGNQQSLVEGMCFSIEPGIYLAGEFGVRIEDIVTVTADGARRLNLADRDLTMVG